MKSEKKNKRAVKERVDCENKDAKVEHLVGSRLSQIHPVCTPVLFLGFASTYVVVLNRRDVLPWYLHSHCLFTACFKLLITVTSFIIHGIFQFENQHHIQP